MSTTTKGLYVRHEDDAVKERSSCGWRYRLVSKDDTDVQAWAHTVDVDESRAHYHKRNTELYYVVEGEGELILDGVSQPIKKGSFAHIPPGVVHTSKGKMKVLVIGVPDIDDSDLYYVDE
jgi:mannose-6-phosphate isomerase-like protein (cupin superfamily)